MIFCTKPGHWALSEPTRQAVLSQFHLDQAGAEQSEEIGVLLWTFLAAKYLDISPAIVFHEHGYKGQSQWLLDNFNSGTYIGLPLLKWMGIVQETPDGMLPKVVNWLRQNQS